MSRIGSGVENVLGIIVALIVFAAIAPTALIMIATSALTSVNAAVITIVQILLPVLAVIGVVLYFVRGKG